MEDITHADYTYEKRAWIDFEIKTIGEYHELYVQSDTLFLAAVFNNFKNMCLELYGLYKAHILSDPGLSGQAAFKKTKAKIKLKNLCIYSIGT